MDNGRFDGHNGTVPIVSCVANLCTDLFTFYPCRNIDIEFVFSCICFFLWDDESSPHNNDGRHYVRRRVSEWPV